MQPLLLLFCVTRFFFFFFFFWNGSDTLESKFRETPATLRQFIPAKGWKFGFVLVRRLQLIVDLGTSACESLTTSPHVWKAPWASSHVSHSILVTTTLVTMLHSHTLSQYEKVHHRAQWNISAMVVATSCSRSHFQ